MREHFSEYFRLAEPEMKKLWSEAEFIFDTNVLLNLYRMRRETSLRMREILQKLKGRLFLPHQVGIEFFKHREEVIADQVNAFERVKQSLQKIPEKFKQELARHPCIPLGEITEALKACADEQVRVVAKCQDENQLNFLKYDDPVLLELDALFADACESPYSDADDDVLNKKVDERIQKNLPPCCVSAGPKASVPTASNPHEGDGRVWFQLVRHAEATKKPIIFVTGDEKSNWWRTAKLGNQDRAIGPHFELIRDVEAASNNRFWMYTQEGFLSEAPKFLGVPEQAQAIEDVRQIRESAPRSAQFDIEEPKSMSFEELKREVKTGFADEEYLEKGEPADEPKSTKPRQQQDE